MAYADESSHKGVAVISPKGDRMIMAGYLACAVLMLVIYYLANTPGKAISEFPSMTIFP